MNGKDRIRDQYPIFFAYGESHDFLDNDEAIAATSDERIRSIWPFLVRRVMAFQGTLKNRERVNFDPEDTITELWAVLKMKDAEWSPERGKYITFAGVIIDREFCSIRDRARTVQSPRNSSCRLKEYKDEAEGGNLTSRRSKTANDIRRTTDGIQQMSTGRDGPAETCRSTTENPANILAEAESLDNRHEAVTSAIQTLDFFETVVIGKVWGLWGRQPKSIFDIAWEAGRDPAEVRRVKARAMKKIKDFLVESRHPASEEVQD